MRYRGMMLKTAESLELKKYVIAAPFIFQKQD
jgi:hypothetical protein